MALPPETDEQRQQRLTRMAAHRKVLTRQQAPAVQASEATPYAGVAESGDDDDSGFFDFLSGIAGGVNRNILEPIGSRLGPVAQTFEGGAEALNALLMFKLREGPITDIPAQIAGDKPWGFGFKPDRGWAGKPEYILSRLFDHDKSVAANKETLRILGEAFSNPAARRDGEYAPSMRNLGGLLRDLGKAREGRSGPERYLTDPGLVTGGAGLAKWGITRGPDYARAAPIVLKAAFGKSQPAKPTGIPNDVWGLIQTKGNPVFSRIGKITKEVAEEVKSQQARKMGAAVYGQNDAIAKKIGLGVHIAPINQVKRTIPDAGEFMDKTIRPAFLDNFGQAPEMAFHSQSGVSEPLIKIFSQGWQERAEKLGLKLVGREKIGDVYTITGKKPLTREITSPAEISRMVGTPKGGKDPFREHRLSYAKLEGKIDVPHLIPRQAPSYLHINPFTNEETFRLMEYARTFQRNPSDIWNNQNALFTILDQGVIPQPAMIARINAMFGEEFAGHLARISRTGGGRGGADRLWSVINLPRTLMATADLSAIARQGRVLGNRNPKEWKDAVTASVHAFKSEDFARAVEHSILTHEKYDWLVKGGIEITRRGPGSRLTGNIRTEAWLDDPVDWMMREEPFMSDLAQNIPGIGKVVRASERAHVTVLNKLRSDVGFKIANNWIKAGRKLDDPKTLADWQAVGKWINTATGRGPIPKAMQPFAPAMNALFFSPRFQASRIHTVGALVQAAKGRNPELIKMIAGDLMATTMTNTTIMAIADAAFDDVSINWRNPSKADFLEIKVGPTKLNFWAGLEAYPQLVWKLLLGTQTARGEKLDRSFGKTLEEFVFYKMSPVVAQAVETARGRGFRGGAMDLARIERDPLFLASELSSNTVPLVAQAILEGLREGAKINNPLLHGAFATLEIIGVTANSYTTYNDAMEYASQEVAGMPLKDVNNLEDLEKITAHPNVQAVVAQNEKERGPGFTTPLGDRVRNKWRTYEQSKTNAEEAFLASIAPRGRVEVKGEALRKQIQAFKVARYNLFDSIFAVPEERNAVIKRREKGPLISTLRDKYWSSQPSIYVIPDDQPGGGSIIYDFDVQDDLRRAVLNDARKDASAEGMSDPDIARLISDIQIRTTDRYEDPLVNQTIRQYEDGMAIIRKYFDIPKIVIGKGNPLYQLYQSQEKESDWPQELKDLKKKITTRRKDMRCGNSNVDRILNFYGFVTTEAKCGKATTGSTVMPSVKPRVWKTRN
jgi:hypothetical protein